MAFGTVNRMPEVRIGPPSGKQHSPAQDGRGGVFILCAHSFDDTPGKAVRSHPVISVGPTRPDHRDAGTEP